MISASEPVPRGTRRRGRKRIRKVESGSRPGDPPRFSFPEFIVRCFHLHDAAVEAFEPVQTGGIPETVRVGTGRGRGR
ncbi:hypothetical protein [Melghirimyces profundicolus]|uniref:hypothetical protein n=1 Tax=Melghirimyces profundicolus TaxID=1242148 RepID=UPI0011B2234F|nr:hypothetical protein [Melghirimyces profundicolus]